LGATCRLVRRVLNERLSRIHFVHTLASQLTAKEWDTVLKTRKRLVMSQICMIKKLFQRYCDLAEDDVVIAPESNLVRLFFNVRHLGHEQLCAYDYVQDYAHSSVRYDSLFRKVWWPAFQREHPLLFSRRAEILQQIENVLK
jgi:hypothetical protein